MKLNSDYRADARNMLGGSIFHSNWLMALLVGLIISAVSSALAMTYIGSLFTGILSAGTCAVFIGLNRKGKVEFGDIIAPVKDDFLGVVILGIMQMLFIMLWSLLFFFPGIVKSYSYSMAFYIKADHPEKNWNECLKESMAMMNGNKWQLFLLDLSFIGWILVSMLTCGIGLLWVAPYMQAAHTAFYEDLKAPVVTAEPAAE